MSTHKHIDKICAIVIIVSIFITVIFMNGSWVGLKMRVSTKGCESRLFDSSKVHTINIVMDDFDSFISNCTNEEFVNCAVIIDNESYKNVGIRAKGNTSMSQVKNYDNDRYSFKIEFDHYEDGT